jgi:hypothetical protein
LVEVSVIKKSEIIILDDTLNKKSEMLIVVGHLHEVLLVEDDLLIEYLDDLDGCEIDDAVLIQLFQ